MASRSFMFLVCATWPTLLWSCSDTCDSRRLGDNRVPGDECWDPPSHYCSAGAGGLITMGCRPDYSVCCMFDSTCLPCGWQPCKCHQSDPPKPEATCSPDAPAGCNHALTDLTDPQCHN